MKRNLFSLYAVFSLAVGLQAQNQMHVNMKDGSVIDIIVSEIESVTWDATNNEGGTMPQMTAKSPSRRP